MIHDLHTLYTEPLRDLPAWIEGGILPKGSFFLFGGASEIGKSFLSLNMMRNLVEGENWFGTEYKVVERPKSILYVDAECGDWVLASRTKKVFEGCKNFGPGMIHAVSHPDIALDQAAERHKFYDLLRSVDPVPDIVFLDPISYLVNGDDSDNQIVKHTYQTLVRAQQEVNPDMTFVMSHHHRKPPSGRDRVHYDPLDPSEFRGASWWLNQAWTAVTLNRLTPNNPDQGWDLDSRIAKIRAEGIGKREKAFVIDGESMRATVRVPEDSTWG